MFVSHQWNGFQHPDPNGVQIDCMVKVFRRLRDGEIARVDTDPFHNILYKTNRVTRKKEWMQLLSNAYIFYDFWSQPQPDVEPEDSPRRAKLEQDLKSAISSMGAYVERSDCLVVLVPGTTHVDRVHAKDCRDDECGKPRCVSNFGCGRNQSRHSRHGEYNAQLRLGIVSQNSERDHGVGKRPVE